jgi:formate dehydrogenase subunit gamma
MVLATYLKKDASMRLALSLRAALAALVLVVLAGLTAPVQAQAQGQINPTAQSVKEQQLLEALKKGTTAEVGGRISIPDTNAATLIRPAGREWREFHQGTMHWVGAIAVLGVLALLTLFYIVRGKIRIDAGPSGRTITRFGSFDRFAHWITAGCFLILALSGLNLTFGKGLLLPLVGPEAFTTLTALGKLAHNYLSFPFMLGLFLMFMLWVKDNIPNGRDLAWFSAGGGLVGKGHPPAERFNGGQKVVFWMVIIGGAALSVSGIYLLFPATAGGVLNLQFWNNVHGIVSLLLTAGMIAHIYIGSIGMEGAFDAMGSGEVDLNWAKEHHSLWVADEMKKGNVPVGGRMQPAE